MASVFRFLTDKGGYTGSYVWWFTIWICILICRMCSVDYNFWKTTNATPEIDWIVVQRVCLCPAGI